MNYIGIDVGEKRVGIATGNTIISVGNPLVTLPMDDAIFTTLAKIVKDENAIEIVIGLPRNMSGEETQQSIYSRDFAKNLGKSTATPIAFQDESLTSKIATQRLEETGKPYQKGDVDKEAAAIILQDYLESKR